MSKVMQGNVQSLQNVSHNSNMAQEAHRYVIPSDENLQYISYIKNHQGKPDGFAGLYIEQTLS